MPYHVLHKPPHLIVDVRVRKSYGYVFWFIDFSDYEPLIHAAHGDPTDDLHVLRDISVPHHERIRDAIWHHSFARIIARHSAYDCRLLWLGAEALAKLALTGPAHVRVTQRKKSQWQEYHKRCESKAMEMRALLWALTD
jgi:hypothetical protein